MTDSFSKNDNPLDEYISLEVTSDCTGSCLHCFAKPLRESGTQLDFNDACSIVDEAYNAGYRHIHITGGEPFLWTHLFSFLNYCKSAGYASCYLNTNGMRLDIKQANKLANFSPWLALSLSVQGEEKNHDFFRGKGTWKTARQGLRMLVSNGSLVDVFTVVSSSMVETLPGFVNALYEELPSIRSVMLIQLINVDGANLDEYLLSPEEFVRMSRSASLLTVSGRSTGVLDNPLASVVCAASSLPWLPSPSHLQRAGRITIRSDKTVTVAHSSTETLGKYEPGKLETLLQSTEYKNMILPESPLCKECTHLALCRANGMNAPSESFRSADKRTPFCKQVLHIT